MILTERMFFDEGSITDEEHAELDQLRLSSGEVKEVFRVFLRATFGDDDIEYVDRKRLLSIAQRLHLPEELVPSITLRAA